MGPVIVNAVRVIGFGFYRVRIASLLANFLPP
jgi:hypothetical protein